jgi:hypothetical protein
MTDKALVVLWSSVERLKDHESRFKFQFQDVSNNRKWEQRKAVRKIVDAVA